MFEQLTAVLCVGSSPDIEDASTRREGFPPPTSFGSQPGFPQAAEFATVKRRLAERFPYDGVGYTDAKDPTCGRSSAERMSGRSYRTGRRDPATPRNQDPRSVQTDPVFAVPTAPDFRLGHGGSLTLWLPSSPSMRL